MKKLQTSGYFEGELEGSKLWQEKMETAKEYFLGQVCRSEGEEDESIYRWVVIW